MYDSSRPEVERLISNNVDMTAELVLYVGKRAIQEAWEGAWKGISKKYRTVEGRDGGFYETISERH
jgi:hypothetical protein